LTINEDNKKLEKQFNELKEKSKDNEYIIRARLQEKESEMQLMKQQISYLMGSQKEILEILKYPERLEEIAKIKL
jgi:phage shock protein A